MTTIQHNNANVRLLACLLDGDDTDDSDYRFLIDGQHIKYITTAPGTFLGDENDRLFEPVLLQELMPAFPTSDWNTGHLARDSESEKATFVKTESVQFPEVKNIWHPLKFHELDFTQKERINQRVRVSTHPELNDGKPVLLKFAVWHWEVPFIEIETTAYQWISNSGVGPRFLGHLTECKDGRVIGFVTEWLEGARAARPDDLDGCSKALSRLHELGIKLGDTNKYNFLVRDDQEVVLVDFETAKKDCSPQELEDEMSALKSNLESTTFQGGRIQNVQADINSEPSPESPYCSA
ncbi:hypothetical protein BGZ63DRAFT_472868 [Mariannaea sp. PMI_226]|nr:hypothetical protein BGZ63DRAFT_472868 [Mariannaea sp. PMI_226]